MKRFIQSQRVVTPEGIRPACVEFEAGTIVSIGPLSNEDALDFGDRLILPGLVDTHVHINQPGRTEWEGFETASRAAAAGGITCFVDMPLNSIPATTNVEALNAKRAAAKGKSLVDYAFWGGAVRRNADELLGLAAAGVRGFKCFLAPSGVEEFEMVDEADLRLALPAIARSGLPLLVHAEDSQALISGNGAVWRKYSEYLASRPDACESRAMEMLVRLCRELNVRIHIVHLASAEALPILAAARAEGLPITAETCPHYLYFHAEAIPDGATEFKCAPPIRELETQNALWEALRSGLIDLVATDHSPCPPAMKKFETGDFAAAWGGIASLSLALPVMYSAARKRNFSMCEIAKWMAERPARLAGLKNKKGRIAVGCDADFVVFAPDSPFEVTRERLHFRHAVTPYLGQMLAGQVERTYLRGECIYADGKFCGTPGGRECRV